MTSSGPRFSSRLPRDLSASPLAAAVEARRASGREILDLTESNPTRAGFAYDPAAVPAAAARPEALGYDPDPRGLPAAREAVAAYYRDHGRTVDPGSVFLTASTSEAYGFLFKLLADPGDRVLVPRPSYPLFDYLASLEAVEAGTYPLRYDDAEGWRIDLERLRVSIDARTRAVVAVSPNNPTGSFLTERERREMSALCAERGLALIVDEVFLDYGNPSRPSAPLSMAGTGGALTFVLSGLSKVAALPQVKLGWIAASGPPAVLSEAAHRLEIVADTYLSVSSGVQHRARELLSGRSAAQARILERLALNDAVLREAWAALGEGRVLARDAGWTAVVELRDDRVDETVARELVERDGVVVHPGYFYDFLRENALVLSLLTPPAAFREGLARLASRLRALG